MLKMYFSLPLRMTAGYDAVLRAVLFCLVGLAVQSFWGVSQVALLFFPQIADAASLMRAIRSFLPLLFYFLL